ncbi:peroxynitrite isomerase THAP4-like [Ornithodoros turicata]|uniref:peroxynitrite isomerase THAP4-like n=1 Tax=Ornithodoros turicata TaxID=34597 RepID=UPI003138ADB7
MGGCVAAKCKNSSAKGYRVFRFPRDSKRRNIWIANVNRGGGWEPTPHSQLCEAHFEDSQFENNRADGRRKLKSSAVPTKFHFDTAGLQKRRRKVTNQENENLPPSAGTTVEPTEQQDVLRLPGVAHASMPRVATGILTDTTNTVGIVPSSEYSAAQVLLSLHSSLQGETEVHATDNTASLEPAATDASAIPTVQEVTEQPLDLGCADSSLVSCNSEASGLFSGLSQCALARSAVISLSTWQRRYLLTLHV